MATALNDASIATAYWLQDEMKDLLDRELSDRKSVLKQAPTIRVVIEKVDRPEEEVQCMHCNSYIYLSQVGCRCTTKVVCRDHISEVTDISCDALRCTELAYLHRPLLTSLLSSLRSFASARHQSDSCDCGDEDVFCIFHICLSSNCL